MVVSKPTGKAYRFFSAYILGEFVVGSVWMVIGVLENWQMYAFWI